MNPEDFEKQLARQPIRPVPTEWRAGILSAARSASLAPGASRPAPSFLSTLNHQLSTLLWPCPQAWAGLAAVWLLILAVNYSSSDKTPTMAQATPPPSPEMMRMVQEQRRMLAQLMEPMDLPPAERPKPFVPRPRGEIQIRIIIV